MKNQLTRGAFVMVSSLFTHSNGTTQPLACSLPCQIKRDIAIIIKRKKKKEKRNIFSFWTLSASSTMLYLYLIIKQSNVAISE